MASNMETREVQKGAAPMGQIKAEYPLGKASGIAVYDNVLDSEFLSNFLNLLSEDFNALFVPGPTLGGVDPFVKLSSDTDFMGSLYGPHLRNFDFYSEARVRVQHDMWSCIADYIQDNRHLWPAPNLNLTGMRIQRYHRNAGYYREHCDGTPWFPPGPDGSIRILAMVVYLNTVKNGGGTVFTDHGYTSDAVAGRVVIFPTTWQYPHMGAVPLSGDKWIISSFVTVRWSDKGMYPFEVATAETTDDAFVQAEEIQEADNKDKT